MTMKRVMLALLLGTLGSTSLFAQFGPTGTTSVQVTVVAEAGIQIDTATTTLTTGGLFSDYTGTTNYTYKTRTSTGGGAGTITLNLAGDFSPATGPSVASGDLTYNCSLTAPVTGTGIACSGPITAATTNTNVATFGVNTHSLGAGTGSNAVDWILTNDPAYETGAYSATATFTISAT